jgi:ferredoxin
MSVEITFEPVGITGLVAEGTYLIDAARRMGVMFPAQCQGPGKCSACVVKVLTGASLLSEPGEHELQTLGPEASGKRLACETRIEKGGELIVEVIVLDQQQKTDVRNTFRELPLDKKLATLVQLEMLTMSEASDAIMQKALMFGGRVKEAITSRLNTQARTGSGPSKPKQ